MISEGEINGLEEHQYITYQFLPRETWSDVTNKRDIRDAIHCYMVIPDVLPFMVGKNMDLIPSF
jgi:hypothetical protein